MRGKRAKYIKRNVRKSTDVLFAALTSSIIKMPFRKRLALAWLITKGVRKSNRKENVNDKK